MPENRGNDNLSEIKTPLGQYFLQERIAQGGMAEIYKGIASDIHGIKRTVVIKKILPNIAANKEYVDMLVSEAKIAVQLSHGNIAQIYDLGRSGNDYFMVMEYVNGKSLSQIHKKCLKNGELIPLEYILYFASEVANGLDYMHNKADAAGNPMGIVHRDISPQNIIVSYSGTVKIIDFGIAKSAFKIDASESGVLKGKFAYMSPEQARGDQIDGRSDIFSLGVILHELSCGRRLFKDKDNKQTIRNVRKAAVEPPSTYNPELSPEFDAAVMRALAKDASKRYRRAGELRSELVKLLYLNSPDFKPASVSGFISELFGENISLLEEETEHTPQLIIDQTQAAISASAPDVMKKFMLEAEKEGEAKEEVKKEKEGRQWRSHLAELAGRWPSAMSGRLSAVRAFALRQFERFRSYLPPAAGIAVVIALLVAGWSTGLFKRWSEFISPTPVVKVAPAPEPVRYVTLEVDSEPRGAAIFIDDRNTGIKTPATFKDIKAGKTPHTIGIYAEGYKFWAAPFTARPDETLNFAPRLTPAVGSLEVVSEPAEADVTVNGEAAGKTPFSKEDIAPGTVLTVKVEKEGYGTWEGSLQIMQEKTSIVRVSLLRLTKRPGAPAGVPPPPVETPEAAAEPEAAERLREAMQRAAETPKGPLKAGEPSKAGEAVKKEEPASSSAEIELRPLPPEIELLPAEPAFPRAGQPVEPPAAEPLKPTEPPAGMQEPGTWNLKPGTSTSPGAPTPETRDKPMELDYR